MLALLYLTPDGAIVRLVRTKLDKPVAEMKSADVVVNILNQHFLRRINFNFGIDQGSCYVKGTDFARIARRVSSGEMQIEVDPNIIGAGEFNSGTLKVKSRIAGRVEESVIVHESTHAIFYYQKSAATPLSQEEEAACYIVNVLYYLMTGLSVSRWAVHSPVRAGILPFATPLAHAILDGNVGAAPNSVALDPAQFFQVVAAVKRSGEYDDEYLYPRAP